MDGADSGAGDGFILVDKSNSMAVFEHEVRMVNGLTGKRLEAVHHIKLSEIGCLIRRLPEEQEQGGSHGERDDPGKEQCSAAR